jgi:hypothetical protein
MTTVPHELCIEAEQLGWRGSSFAKASTGTRCVLEVAAHDQGARVTCIDVGVTAAGLPRIDSSSAWPIMPPD